METITYNFCEQTTESSNFYMRLEKLTDKIIHEASELIPYASLFSEYTGKEECSKKESIQHYLMEMISIGIYWKNYINKSFKKSKAFFAIAKKMNQLRSNYPSQKMNIDHVRGIINTHLNEIQPTGREIVYSLRNFKSLISWMEAAGDYPQTTMVLRRWEAFLKKQSFQMQHDILSLTRSFSIQFEEICDTSLGNYFEHLPEFFSAFMERYKFREDILFCGRQKNEYYLNITGACIMNRDLKAEFLNTTRKIILLPACVKKYNESCAAVKINNAYICQGCREDCNVNNIKQEIKDSAELLLVPHSSDFEKELHRYSGQKNTGFIGVACVLNLLEGGYAMKNLDLPAQCVFLDYCGCKNHWHHHGIPTDLNRKYLNNICNNTNVCETLPVE